MTKLIFFGFFSFFLSRTLSTVAKFFHAPTKFTRTVRPRCWKTECESYTAYFLTLYSLFYSSSLFYFWINFVLLVTTSYFNLCYHVYPFMYIYHVYLFMYIYHLYPFLAMYIYHVYPFMYIYHLYPFMYYLSCISLYEYLSCISHIPLLSHASL